MNAEYDDADYRAYVTNVARFVCLIRTIRSDNTGRADDHRSRTKQNPEIRDQRIGCEGARNGRQTVHCLELCTLLLVLGFLVFCTKYQAQSTKFQLSFGKWLHALDRFFEIRIAGRERCSALISSERFRVILRHFVCVTKLTIDVDVFGSLLGRRL